MQSTFPSPGAIAPSGGNMTGGAQKIAGGIKSEETRDASGGGVFTPFLSLLSQALDRTEQGEPGENPVAVPFDAELFAARDEADAERMATPSDGMNETLLFSKSVLDLMVSIKNGLEEKGVDVAGLSRQVGEVLGEVLPGLDMERLRAMMTRLRNQYDSAADAASVSGVREGVDAALNSSESGGVSGEGGPTAVNFPTFFPVSPEAQDTGDATNAVSESVALSRFASYLRADARSASRETSKEGTADEG
ncbi:MAG: hypothetical protein LBT65_09270, partial [Synergistaceae bacterium]|nr:hypothetical protein [Synergistaceae bacterium]